MSTRALLVVGLLLAVARVAVAQTVDPSTVAASQADIDNLRVNVVALGCLLCYALGFLGGNLE